MAIPLPNLDDRTYADLLDRARAQIPRLCPNWTDHNPTDPGIILIEMFAWLMEMMLYRVDQIPAQNYQKFLKLLNGGDTNIQTIGDLHSDVTQTVRALRERYRAATAEDFERLVLEDWHRSELCLELGAAGQVQRAKCLPERNIENPDPVEQLKPAPGHISLVVLPPEAKVGSSLEIKPSPALLASIWRYFEERRLLTTRHHIVAPDYVKLNIQATIYLEEDASVDILNESILSQLNKFFHPLTGGPDGTGWPFGRGVHLSEIYAILDQVPGVDFVRDAQIGDSGKELTSLKLEEHQLVALDTQKVTFTFMERLGDEWKIIG